MSYRNGYCFKKRAQYSNCVERRFRTSACTIMSLDLRMLSKLKKAAIEIMGDVQPTDGWADTDLGLRIRRIAHRRRFECDLRGPLVGLVLQGSKATSIGGRRFVVAAGEAMIVSHHVPAVSRVIDGSEERPYIALMLPIDMTLLGTIGHELRDLLPDRPADCAIGAMVASPEILDTFGRLLSTASNPIEARILAPLIVQEIHLRFLMAEEGAILRALLTRDSRASRVSRSIVHLRQCGHRPVSVHALASIAGMSTSSFYSHFKTVTGLTPLAFQKELMLMRAQDLLRDPEQNVSTVAFAVGYESPTQFSREYSRRFGSTPREHRERARRRPRTSS